MRAVSLIGAMTAAIMVAGGVASAGPCEKTLSPSPDSGPDCYVARAGSARCEGMYISPVSGTPIELVSLTHGTLVMTQRTQLFYW